MNKSSLIDSFRFRFIPAMEFRIFSLLSPNGRMRRTQPAHLDGWGGAHVASGKSPSVLWRKAHPPKMTQHFTVIIVFVMVYGQASAHTVPAKL
jgi:hypothetical protein